jgi:hypothetical protein
LPPHAQNSKPLANRPAKFIIIKTKESKGVTS